MRKKKNLYKILTVFLTTVVLMIEPDMALSQVVHGQCMPDAVDIIQSDDILCEISFDQSVLDNMRVDFLNIPGNTTFAAKREVCLNPANSGKTVTGRDGDKVWYLKIRSEGAKSINIIFSRYMLFEGEKVFIYNTSLGSVKGPFTRGNNKETGSLATMPVAGEEVIIEYHMRAPGGENRLEVGQIAHDFIGIAGDNEATKDIYYGSSQPCNVDINCESGQEWQLEKNSVVRIIAGGTELGSGFLVNNTRQENIAFVITANHVIRTEQNAVNSIYVFRYESPFCDGPDGLTDYSLSGAEMMAEDVSTDFTLVRLSSFPPLTYKPYLAGWDVRGVIPENTVTIHHPSGDVKKITTDFDSPIISTFQNLYTNGFWKVLRWEEGTTEGGSSGSPLFDQDHRVVGYLTGGEAVCGNSINDYFARMDVAYDVNSDIYGSIKPWIDPARSGVKVLDGRDPYRDNKADFDTLCNCTGDERYLTAYDPPATGYTTGYNSDSTVMYAEKFSVEAGKEIIELIMEIGDSRMISNYDSITVYIMSGITEPGSVLAKRSIYLGEALASNYLNIDFVNSLPLPESFFVAWHLWYNDKAEDEQQQFAVFHGSPVALSENTAYFKDKLNWYPFYDHPYNPSPLNLCVRAVVTDSTVLNIPDTLAGNIEMVKLYPNPVSDLLNVRILADVYGEVKYSLLSITGVVFLQGYFNSSGPGSEQEIDLSAVPSGIYFLTLENYDSFSSNKLIRK